MPRKLPDSDAESQKENQDAKPSISKAKVKSEMRRTNRGEDHRGERRGSTLTSVSVEEGVQGTTDDINDDEIGSPNGKKRARLNEEGDGVPVKEDKVNRPRRVTLPRDRDGYVPGSVVRVQLENFVTYDFVEFRPGPNLNMILGPNGTGKSSIACALCIGLNGAPSILGRSTELNAFVKHGHDKGYVEIELKGKIGTPNLVIRRNINSKNRGSQFTLNGQVVPGREIGERIAELNVQVGNLCSFLPQDRVSEFAQMTPQQLLKETQRTAGDENLTTWHSFLIEKGKELGTAQTDLKEDKKHLLQLEEKQKSVEKVVERYKERRNIEHRIELFEIVLPYVEYRESKEVYDRAKVARDKAAAEYRRLEEANKPLKDLQSELNEQYKSLENERNELKKEVSDGWTKSLNSIKSRNDKASSTAEEALETIKTLKRKERDRIKNIAKTKDDIIKLQEKVDNPPEIEDVQAINDQMKTIRNQQADLNYRKQQIKGQVEGLIHENSRHDQTVLQCQHELQKLDSLTEQKLNKLAKWDRDCADVILWLQKNKESNPFAQRVSLPAFVSLSVRDQRYVHAVEACLSATQIKTFVTHSEEDFKTFNTLFIDTPEAVGRKVRVTVWYRPHNEAQLLRPPLDLPELQSIGFDGYAIDYIECPEGLRWFLAKELNMHRTPVSLDASKVDENRAQDALSRPSPDGRPPANCTYIAGDTIGTVSRSLYGQRKSINSTRTIQKARNLVDQSADPAEKREIEQRIAEARDQGTKLALQINQLHKEDQGIFDNLQALKVPFDELAGRKKAAALLMQRIKTNESRLVSLKTHLEDLESRPSADIERSKHQAVVEKTVKDRTKILNEFVALMQNLIKKQTVLSTMLLQQIQLNTDIEALDTLCHERTSEAKRVKQTFDEACARFEEAKKDSTAKVRATRAKLASVDGELQDAFRTLEEEDQQKEPEDRWSTEKVTLRLETERAKLELNHATDAGVLQDYDTRARQIGNLQKKIEQQENKTQKLEEKIQKTKNLWYPALTSLVTAIGEKFSAAFDHIGRAGEIKIAESEDYEKWAIEIFVKFRNEEPLTLLNGQRQSGGERSLTTIMYLMSLTEHARAPFSLVDEINQGMDQQYERDVHNQLVNVTCNAESGQYFLITPKLLPGLQYHKDMKILCVNNGEWLPESKGLGNMGKMLDQVEARRRAGRTSH